jgi:hypothetical protein
MGDDVTGFLAAHERPLGGVLTETGRGLPQFHASARTAKLSAATRGSAPGAAAEQTFGLSSFGNYQERGTRLDFTRIRP